MKETKKNKANEFLGSLLFTKNLKASGFFEPIVSIFLAFLFGSIVILLIGENPLSTYKLMFGGAFGSLANITNTFNKVTTLTLTGLSYAFAFRCGMVNIGAEGQLYIGALCSSIVVLRVPGPAPLVILLALLAGFLGGGLFGLLIGFLKVTFGANEVITTVMLNYVAQYLVLWAISGPIKDPNSLTAQTAVFEESYWLPSIFPGTKIQCGILLMVASLIFFGIFLWKMVAGFEMQVVGQNSSAAAYAGVNVKKNRLLSMFLAGGFGGLAGAIEVLGVQHRLLKGVSSNYGFDGIAVALLGNNTPIGMFLSGILIGAMKSGGNNVQMFSKVPSSVVDLIRALMIVFVLVNALHRFLKKREMRRDLLNV